MNQVLVALEPKSFEEYVLAIEAAGATVSPLGPDVRALVWTDYSQPELLADVLRVNPQLEWVQLPFAGVDAFAEVIAEFPLRFTSAKGAFSEPVAEHALALALALARKLPERARANSWGKKFAKSMFDAEVLIIGAGGITQKLIELLRPFRPKITVVRNRLSRVEGAETISSADFFAALPGKDFIFINCALTESTKYLFSSAAFDAIDSHAFLVNIARGPIVDTDALVSALRAEKFAGYATDVTDPEPLPEGHPLWSEPRVLITPHSADTKAMVLPLFARRLDENVRAFMAGSGFVGEVDPVLGY